MKFEAIMDGLVNYIKAELYPVMTDWQKLIAADVVSRCITRAEVLKKMLEDNTYARALGYIDSENNVDVEGIMATLKNYISEKGKLVVKFPLMPEYTFYCDDVDVLRRMIEEARR